MAGGADVQRSRALAGESTSSNFCPKWLLLHGMGIGINGEQHAVLTPFRLAGDLFDEMLDAD